MRPHSLTSATVFKGIPPSWFHHPALSCGGPMLAVDLDPARGDSAEHPAAFDEGRSLGAMILLSHETWISGTWNICQISIYTTSRWSIRQNTVSFSTSRGADEMGK